MKRVIKALTNSQISSKCLLFAYKLEKDFQLKENCTAYPSYTVIDHCELIKHY